MKPRLKQPLFNPKVSAAYHQAADDYMTFRLATAYDVIWNLLYFPDDIDHRATVQNAEATLENLGGFLEGVLTASVFELETDPKQLSFNLEGKGD